MISITKKRAFSLIELMVVVVIISILASVAYVKTISLSLKSKENVLKNNLSVLRSAMNVYRIDNGYYPSDPLLFAKTNISNSFFLDVPAHGRIENYIVVDATSTILDTGMLAYVLSSSSPHYGAIYIDCNHKDSSGKYFYEY